MSHPQNQTLPAKTVSRSSRFIPQTPCVIEDIRAFAVAADALPTAVAVVVSADNKKIVYVNPALQELYQASSRAIVGRKNLDYFIPEAEDRQQLKELLLQSGVVRNFETVSARRNGEKIRLQVSQRRVIYSGREAVLMTLEEMGEDQEITALREQLETLQARLQKNLRERELLSCELHDGLVQEMTSSLLFLETAADRWSKGKAGFLGALRRGLGTLRDGVGEARRLIAGLRPGALERQGIAASLQNLIEKHQKNYGVKIEFRQQLETPLPSEHEDAVFRIVQEGLHNLVRHSQSDRGRVTLMQTEGALYVELRDWGIGIDPQHMREGRYGLRGIRQRARALGGSATIENAEDQGLLIHVELPLPSPEHVA